MIYMVVRCLSFYFLLQTQVRSRPSGSTMTHIRLAEVIVFLYIIILVVVIIHRAYSKLLISLHGCCGCC